MSGYSKAPNSSASTVTACLDETVWVLETTVSQTLPVDAIHGTNDPHPVQGVSEPLPAHLPDSSCQVFDRCGRKPWRE